MLKRTLLVAMTSIMVVGSLTGCGNKSDWSCRYLCDEHDDCFIEEYTDKGEVIEIRHIHDKNHESNFMQIIDAMRED